MSTYESLFGELVPTTAAGSQGLEGQGVLAFSTVPYIPDVEREGKCLGKEDTCGAWRVKGEEYCAGHLRSIRGNAE